ncbi:MAG: hypothetical protein ACXVJ7_13735 [Acidimicrobiia bacterium]
MTRWEYRLEVLELPGKDDPDARIERAAALDQLGAEGWEAVGVTPTHAASHGLRVETTRFIVLLKRPIR